MVQRGRTRGLYYATGTEVRENGKRYGVQVGRQLPSLRVAIAALNASGLSGSVQRWNAKAHQRDLVANRDEDGTWWRHPRGPMYEGQRVALDPTTGKPIEEN